MRKDIEGKKMALDSERWLFSFYLNNYLSCTMNITEMGIYLPTFDFLPVLFSVTL
jgi:hypothetical protein